MRVLRTLAVAGIAAMASIANAALVTVWDYSVTAAFNVPATCFTNGCGPGQPNTTDTTSLLAWGIPAGGSQSSLVITNSPATGSVNTHIGGGLPTGPEIGPTNIFTHNNFPVFAPFLVSTVVDSTLTLKPNTPPHPGFPTFPGIQFPVNFSETFNPGPCANGDPAPCPDIFVIGNSSFNFPFAYDETTNQLCAPFGPGSGPNCQAYFVSIFPLTQGVLTPLAPAYCAAAGVAAGCIGFVTPENQSTSVQFALAITTVPLVLPEPGMLALFALALVALGFTIQRRRA